MRTNFKSAAVGALVAASAFASVSQAHADWRYAAGPGYHHGYGMHGYGMHGYGMRDYGAFGHHHRFAPYVVGGIYAGAAIAGATSAYGSDYGYNSGADYQTAPAYGAEPAAYAAAPAAYAPQSYAVPTTVYRQVTQNYTVPVRSYRYVQHTHYVPVTSYQAVTTNVAVPVTTYETYQRTVDVPETVYRPVHTCGCSHW
jgi:hypothetical protein